MTFKFLTIPAGEQEVKAYETWEVRWQSRYGEFSGMTKPEIEAFGDKESADKFANALRDAFRITRTSSGNSVTVGKRA